MTADFFYKKVYKIGIGSISILFSAVCMIYALFLSRVKTIEMNTGFFYLVRDEINVEVGVEFVKLEGGAGYLLRDNSQDYVVLSVYFDKNDALAVQTALTQGKPTKIVYKGVDTLYFKTNTQKKNATVYTGALKIFYSCMQVFDGGIGLLEDGATQERVKGILAPLSRQFGYLSKEYATIYPDFSSVCHRYSQRIDGYDARVLFVGDLRYDLCEMTGDYLALVQNFSI